MFMLVLTDSEDPHTTCY